MNLKIDNTPESHELVFLGQGLYVPEKNIDDFQGIEMEGKAGIAFYGAPWELDPEAIQASDHVAGKATQIGVHKGSMLIYVTPELDAPEGAKVSMEIPMMKGFSQFPVTRFAESESIRSAELSPILLISPKTFDKTLATITGKNFEQWQKRLNEPERLQSFPLAAKVVVTIDATITPGMANNVVARLESNDPEYGKEWIVLTAHYDHMGAMNMGKGQDSIFNGADDNASGTAAIMEIARRLAETPNLRRSIMVSFNCGEECMMLTHPTLSFLLIK